MEGKGSKRPEGSRKMMTRPIPKGGRLLKGAEEGGEAGKHRGERGTTSTDVWGRGKDHVRRFTLADGPKLGTQDRSKSSRGLFFRPD